MERCSTCEHWTRSKPDGSTDALWFTEFKPSIHGVCSAFKGHGPLPMVAGCSDPSAGEYGPPQLITGPAFGCVHHSAYAKRREAASNPFGYDEELSRQTWLDIDTSKVDG